MDSWTTFWKMTLNSLESLEISQDELEKRFDNSRWPLIPPHLRPPTRWTIDKVRSFLFFETDLPIESH